MNETTTVPAAGESAHGTPTTVPAYGTPAYGTPPQYAPAAGTGRTWTRQDAERLLPRTGPATTMTETERAWSVAAHLSGFVAAWVALGFLGPLTVWLLAGRDSQVVRRHAVEALNFNLSVLLYAAVSAVLLIVLVGFLLLPAVGLLYLVASIVAAHAASQGRDVRYPLTLRFIR